MTELPKELQLISNRESNLEEYSDGYADGRFEQHYADQAIYNKALEQIKELESIIEIVRSDAVNDIDDAIIQTKRAEQAEAKIEELEHQLAEADNKWRDAMCSALEDCPITGGGEVEAFIHGILDIIENKRGQ